MMMMMITMMMMILLVIVMLSEGLQINMMMKKSMMSSLIAMTVVMNPCYADYLDGIDGSNEVSLIVPSRKVVIKIPDDDLQAKPDPTAKQVESIDEVLKLIPSWKYFKIIAKEYSSRSSSYKEGEENLIAPFM